MSDGIPDISKQPREWFNYFDDDRNGVLTKNEIIQALIYTLNTYDVEYVTSFVENMWPSKFTVLLV
jgi:Ca2+-binding EF-hand superfamily protein